MLKKWISILLCTTLLIATVSFCICAENDELPLLITSDLHYMPTPSQAQNNFPGSKYYCASDSTNLCVESEAIVKQFLRQAAQSEAQIILISGDMVDDGTVEHHESLIRILRDFENRTGKQIYVINGNHDFLSGISMDTFKSLYADFGYSEAQTVDPNTCSYTADLTGKYRLLALDTCNHINGADGVTAELLDWADAQAAQAQADGRELIVMMHHNFLEHMALQSVLLSKYIISPKWNMKNRLMQWGVRYVFTGHQHGHDVTSYTDSRTNQRVFDIMTTSLTAYPCAYRTGVLSESGLELQTQRISGVQREDLPRDGYTPELLQELTTELDTYAYGCFSMIFFARKQAFFSAGAVGEIVARLHVPALTDLANAYFPTFFAYFDTPIYKKDAGEGISLEKLADGLGLKLPQSNLRTISDLLFHFIAIYYYGDEALPYTDPQINLFMQCVYTVLYTSLRDVSAAEKASLLSDIRHNFKTDALPFVVTKFGQTLVGAARDECVLQIVIVTLSPMIEMFSQDDGLADNDVFLPAEDEAPSTAVQFILHIIERIVHFFLRYVNGLNRLAAMYTLR